MLMVNLVRLSADQVPASKRASRRPPECLMKPAVVLASTLPVVIAYILMTRQFQSGLTAGAVKG